MKVTVLQQDLSKALQVASRYTSSRAQLPILSHIKLETVGTTLSISATNLDMSVSTSIGAKVSEEGSIALPAKTVTDLIGNIDSEHLDISVKEEKATISSQNAKTHLMGSNTADFPEIVDTLDEKKMTLSTKDFIESLPQVAFCSSLDDTRPALSGVLFIFDSQFSLVSSDGFRLSKVDLKLPENSYKHKCILPKNLVAELLKIIKDEKQSLEYFYSEENKSVQFVYDNFVITSRVVDGDYPNFEKIIPQSHRVSVNAAKSDLQQSLKVISVIARDAANIAEFKFDNNSISVSAENNTSGDGVSEVAAKVEGGNASIMFNYKYIQDFLSSIKGESISVELNDSSSAGLFRDSQQKNYLHLIMPVKL